MIFTDDKELFEKMFSIKEHGTGSERYKHVCIGINGRLDSIQAAVLLAKMEIFEEEIQLRQEVAERYNTGLKGSVKIPFIKKHNLSAWAQYSVMHQERENLISKLSESGIPTAIYYPIPLHLQEAFSRFGYKEGDFPVSERVSREIFSLPMNPYLSHEDQERIIEIINKFF